MKELENKKLKYIGGIAKNRNMLVKTKSKGLKEYQVRGEKSIKRHFILVYCAYTFILWHKLTEGLRRRWANKPLKTFPEALEAFRTTVSYRFFEWLNYNRDVFIAYKARLSHFRPRSITLTI